MAKKSRKSRKKGSKARGRYKAAKHAVKRAVRKSRRPAKSHKAHKPRKTRRTRRIHTKIAAKRRHYKLKTRRGKRRVVRTNPSSLAGAIGLKGFGANLKAVTGGGIKGFALATAGAAGAVVGGTVLQSITTPIVAKIAPSLVAHPIASRILAGANFLAAGALLAKFIGKNPQTKKALLVGSAVAGILEIIKPGLVRENLAKIPGVGAAFARPLSDVEGELGDYVQNLLGLGNVQRMDDYVQLNDYTEIPTINGYSLSDYSLGCDASDDER